MDGKTENSKEFTLKVATFNAGMFRRGSNKLTKELEKGESEKIRKIAAIIQKIKPDIIFINEIDKADKNTKLFIEKFLNVGQFGQEAINYQSFTSSVNTGLWSGQDFDQDGKVRGPSDCYGFGWFQGQYSMALLVRPGLEIDRANARTFQKFLWKDMPGALLPENPSTKESYYSKQQLEVFRLSSKNHWDIPIKTPTGQVVHILAAHPTPPVFDGPEDRNGRRNSDEIRFWKDYVDGAAYFYDDQGRKGGLAPNSAFVVVGDYNADPNDGASRPGAIQQLLDHDKMKSYPLPASSGGTYMKTIQGGPNLKHKTDPAYDTADFREDGQNPGNLVADYVLPSKLHFEIVDQMVFWPIGEQFGANLITASDHRMVVRELKFKANK